MTIQSVNPQFIQSIHAGLKYWQQKTKEVKANQAQWLDRQRRNLFQAILFGIETEETWEATVTVLLQSFDFVEWGGYWQEWIPILEQALASAPDKVAVVNGRLQNRLGQLYRLSQQHVDAITQHEKALHMAVKLADKALETTGYAALCEVYLDLKKIDRAEEYGNLALAIAKETQESNHLLPFLYKNLGLAAYFTGNWKQAIEQQKQAIRIWRLQNNLVYLARSLNDLGNSYIGAKDFLAAQLAFEEAGSNLQGTINESDKAMVCINLGVLYYRQKKWLAAEDAFLQINPTMLHERKNLALLAHLHNNLGNVYLKLSRWQDSIDNLKEAIKLFRTLNNKLDLANSLGTLGEVFKACSRLSEAAACYLEALALLKQFPQSHWAEQLYQDFSFTLQQIQKP